MLDAILSRAQEFSPNEERTIGRQLMDSFKVISLSLSLSLYIYIYGKRYVDLEYILDKLFLECII